MIESHIQTLCLIILAIQAWRPELRELTNYLHRRKRHLAATRTK